MKNVITSLFVLLTTYSYGSVDTLRILAEKTMDYEYNFGSADGTGLSNYGNPALGVNPTKEQAIDWYMINIVPELKPYFQTQMELGEACDFLYNTGKDVRGYAIQEYLKTVDPNNYLQWKDMNGNYIDRNNKTKWSIYWKHIQQLPTNKRRIFINLGRDWYYQHINNPTPGTACNAYWKTWYGRIWNTNDLEPFNKNNPKFNPIKQ